MGIVNVKVGSTVVPMELEDGRPARECLNYICKMLGVAPADMLPKMQYNNTPDKFHLKPLGGSEFAASQSLRDKGYADVDPDAFKGMNFAGGNKLSDDNLLARTVEMYDPLDPSYEPPYPEEITGNELLPFLAT